ncbi:MAG: hypothetical protein K1X39_08825 [Thermoflexales bacterium]|nr:hypothetical protein [Thermoflexales bacterium]
MPAQAVYQPRVVALVHNPTLESQGGRKLNAVMRWNDPEALMTDYIDDVAAISHGRVRYRVVDRIEVDDFPRKVDGFRYTDASFVRAWRAKRGFHEPDTADYGELLALSNFTARVEANQADELWLFAFPYGGYYESRMGGRGAIWCNGPVIEGSEGVSRRFAVMGFNYERGVGEMLENLGHRAESILEHVFRRTAPADHLWHRFIQHEHTHPGQAACGNVHFAPNSERDYDWGNPRPVRSTADDWLRYPVLTGAARTMTCQDWGNGDIRDHHVWWMSRFPHLDGVNARGYAHDWWRYIVGLDF